jgi:hypothetical protein
MKAASITLIATIHGFTVGCHSTAEAPLIPTGMAVVLNFQFTPGVILFGFSLNALPKRLRQEIAAA